MRKILIAIIAGLFVAVSAPVFADDSMSAPAETKKDECLLYSKKCANQVDSLQERIKKLNEEIGKGTKTYSPDELKKLENKLEEANKLLDDLMNKY